MDTIFLLVDSLHSVYIDDISFAESVENGVLYSVVLPGSENVVGRKAVFLRNFEENVEKAFVNDVGIKLALDIIQEVLMNGEVKDSQLVWALLLFSETI